MNTYFANTGNVDDFGNMIERDADAIVLQAQSLTGFYFV